MHKSSNQLGSRSCTKSSKELGKKVCKKSSKGLGKNEPKNVAGKFPLTVLTFHNKAHSSTYARKYAKETCEILTINKVVNVHIEFRHKLVSGGCSIFRWLAIRRACTPKAMDGRAQDGKG